MRLAIAQRAADKLVELLAPACHRTTYAGSVLRECADCGDVEILIIPKWGEAHRDGELFPANHNLAQLAIEEVGETLKPIKPGVALEPATQRYAMSVGEALQRWPLKPKGKYWRLWMPNLQATADVFVQSPETWGLNLAIRTGSAEFSHGLATRWNQLGGVFAGARLVDSTPKKLDTPEERDVFHHLEIEWVEPRDRTGKEAIRPL